MFKTINGFDDYEISYGGLVYSKLRKSCIGRVIGGKFLKPCTTTMGYPYVILRKDGKSYNRMVHRLVAHAFVPNPDNKPTVNHIDGDKSNNFAFNLEWCTQKENVNHAINLGLNRWGGRN